MDEMIDPDAISDTVLPESNNRLRNFYIILGGLGIITIIIIIMTDEDESNTTTTTIPTDSNIPEIDDGKVPEYDSHTSGDTISTTNIGNGTHADLCSKISDPTKYKCNDSYYTTENDSEYKGQPYRCHWNEETNNCNGGESEAIKCNIEGDRCISNRACSNNCYNVPCENITDQRQCNNAMTKSKQDIKKIHPKSNGNIPCKWETNKCVEYSIDNFDSEIGGLGSSDCDECNIKECTANGVQGVDIKDRPCYVGHDKGNCGLAKNVNDCHKSWFTEGGINRGKACYWDSSKCTYPGNATLDIIGCDTTNTKCDVSSIKDRK